MRRLLASVGASVLLLAGFLYLIGPDRLVRQLVGADVGIFALGLVAIVVALVCWSEATRRLFVAHGTPVTSRRAFFAYGAGVLGKQLLPMGNAGGPAIMAYAFDREVKLGYGRSLAFIVVIEFLSLVASLVLGITGIVVLVSMGRSGTELRWLATGVAVVAASLAALAIVVWYRRRHVAIAVAATARLLRPLLGRVSPRLAVRLEPRRTGDALARCYGTLDEVVADRRTLLSTFLLVQLGWVSFTLPLYTGALALQIRLPLALVIFLVPTVGLAMVLPLPGGLGGVEVVLAWLLTVFAGIEFGAAGAVVVLYRLCSFWFFVLVGGICGSLSTVSVKELARSQEAMRPVTPDIDRAGDGS